MTTVPGDLLSRVTGNAARSRSWGGEVELSYAATDRLDLYGSVGLLKTRFIDFNDDQWGSFSGLPFPGAPERSIALGFRWGDDLGWFGAASAKDVSSSLSRLEPGAGTGHMDLPRRGRPGRKLCPFLHGGEQSAGKSIAGRIDFSSATLPQVKSVPASGVPVCQLVVWRERRVA